MNVARVYVAREHHPLRLPNPVEGLVGPTIGDRFLYQRVLHPLMNYHRISGPTAHDECHK